MEGSRNNRKSDRKVSSDVKEALSEVSNDSSEDLMSKKVKFEEEESLWNEAFALGENEHTVPPLDRDFPPLGAVDCPKRIVKFTTEDSLEKEQLKPASQSAGKKKLLIQKDTKERRN